MSFFKPPLNPAQIENLKHAIRIAETGWILEQLAELGVEVTIQCDRNFLGLPLWVVRFRGGGVLFIAQGRLPQVALRRAAVLWINEGMPT